MRDSLRIQGLSELFVILKPETFPRAFDGAFGSKKKPIKSLSSSQFGVSETPMVLTLFFNLGHN